LSKGILYHKKRESWRQSDWKKSKYKKSLYMKPMLLSLDEVPLKLFS
jgi:hypothetical protein